MEPLFISYISDADTISSITITNSSAPYPSGAGFAHKREDIFIAARTGYSHLCVFDVRLCSMQLNMRNRLRRIVWVIWAYMRRHTMSKHDFRSMLCLPAVAGSGYQISSRDLHLFLLRTYRNHPTTDYAGPAYSQSPVSTKNIFMGGGHRHSRLISSEDVADFVVKPTDFEPSTAVSYAFATYTDGFYVDRVLDENQGSVAVNMSLEKLAPLLTVKDLTAIVKIHRIVLSKRETKEMTIFKLSRHHCPSCETHFTVLVPEKTLADKLKERKKAHKEKSKQIKSQLPPAAVPAIPSTQTTSFPPAPPTKHLLHKIIEGYCKDMDPTSFQEEGCCVCGQLTLQSELKSPEDSNLLEILHNAGATRKERSSATDAVCDIDGPAVADDCNKVCHSCSDYLGRGIVPPKSLANFLWIGKIPEVLKDLTFAEQILIARVRHNHCLVRVSSGRAKMIANCIMFAAPTARVYEVLPPSREDLSEVLACVFIGSNPPTETDYERMPMLVRRNKVKDALEWLKLNHSDYEDLCISYDNLESYPLSGVPVIVDFKKSDSDGNKIATAMSKFDNEMEESTTEGPCPFTVHGLTGDEYEKMLIDALKVRALRHLEKNGGSLAVGHDASPQSVYNNPQLYPQMFPWLFPYGKGGIGQNVHNGKLSAAEHKKHLLMYHDKRFQTNYYFPMIAFNQEQIKKCATGSYLVTKRRNFAHISK